MIERWVWSEAGRVWGREHETGCGAGHAALLRAGGDHRRVPAAIGTITAYDMSDDVLSLRNEGHSCTVDVSLVQPISYTVNKLVQVCRPSRAFHTVLCLEERCHIWAALGGSRQPCQAWLGGPWQPSGGQ